MTIGRVALLVAIGLTVTACAEDVDVSRDEAVEVLVLDGVERERAECIVDGVDGEVPLARVTGVDPEITEDELALLATVSAGCATAPTDETTILDADSPEGRLDIREGGGIAVDVDERIDALVTGGLDPVVGECVRSAVLASTDPEAALDDANFITEAIRVCSG